MTNEVGKALFSKAGELGIPVGFMCMKVLFCLVTRCVHIPNIKFLTLKGHFQGLSLHISEIEELCTEFPSTVVSLDHLAFCKPPT